jgi:hypothetical protein
MVDKKVESLIKALRERESIELQSLSKANTDCKELLGEATKQQQIYQDMIKQCHEVALYRLALNRAAELTDPHPNGMYPSHVSYVFGTRFHICKTYPFWRTE